MKFRTTDLCDEHTDEVQVAEPIFKDYGATKSFYGPIATVQTYEDNVVLRKILEQPGNGRVMVVDGGGSLRRAIIGGIIAEMARKNGWAGIVIFGCIRDVNELVQIEFGIKALQTVPLRPKKEGVGHADVVVSFAGVTFVPGHYLYADEDGLIVSAHPFELTGKQTVE